MSRYKNIKLSKSHPTLRDQYRMAALQGMLASPAFSKEDTDLHPERWRLYIVEQSIGYGDALFDARLTR